MTDCDRYLRDAVGGLDTRAEPDQSLNHRVRRVMERDEPSQRWAGAADAMTLLDRRNSSHSPSRRPGFLVAIAIAALVGVVFVPLAGWLRRTSLPDDVSPSVLNPPGARPTAPSDPSLAPTDREGLDPASPWPFDPATFTLPATASAATVVQFPNGKSIELHLPEGVQTDGSVTARIRFDVIHDGEYFQLSFERGPLSSWFSDEDLVRVIQEEPLVAEYHRATEPVGNFLVRPARDWVLMVWESDLSKAWPPEQAKTLFEGLSISTSDLGYPLIEGVDFVESDGAPAMLVEFAEVDWSITLRFSACNYPYDAGLADTSDKQATICFTATGLALDLYSWHGGALDLVRQFAVTDAR